jgi:hypothetical protein
MPGTPRATSIAAWEQGKSLVSIAMGLHQKWMVYYFLGGSSKINKNPQVFEGWHQKQENLGLDLT